MRVILIVVMIALLAAFVVLLLKKVGVIEAGQIYGSRLVSELCHCDFCLSWWACLFIAVVIAITETDFCVVFYAMMATPITRQLV